MPESLPPVTAILVVPCYNEARRFRRESFAQALTERPELGLLFVDDGSRDETRKVLEEFVRAHPRQAAMHALESNKGKAEAVREGVLLSFAADRDLPWPTDRLQHVGYWDADLATPFCEFPRFLEIFREKPELRLVMGARVNLLGRAIRRRAVRHYLGRVFATVASFVLKLPVYDTQCGAKVFRYSPDTRRLFEAPFISGWIFDVELLARLGQQSGSAYDSIYELPLLKWEDVAGSKVKARDFLQAMVSLFRIAQLYPRSGSQQTASLKRVKE